MLFRSFLKPDGIAKMENMYNATFVMESCIKGKNGWANFPAAIFYTEEAHPEGSNYFALYHDGSPSFGPSIFMTSAPRSPKSIVQYGPASILVKSRTLIPLSGLFFIRKVSLIF